MGREFVDIFDEWVDTYDDSVNGKDEEYREVFAGYDDILQKVADEARGLTVEFGVGTGNLTEKLLAKGLTVLGVEPNKAMRDRTQARFPASKIVDGDFTSFPLPEQPIDTFVSTYAFHHLTDEEKAEAAAHYASILASNGQVVFADTMFKDDEARINQWEKVGKQGYKNLLEDLQREYYTTLPIMKKIFEEAGFAISFTPLNDYVWLIHARKQN
ncbi:class I SAM-dependent methyltransferase [Jeotgalibacillus sp. S-D1]|uniref:class I SAM-dependent methyltransferase n=1 Tax=Jeotgalibacillus sp. S-D1 TaxID=2552189 RepID=UPI00105A84FC|nr:class I SAM-dependent methyltransferase [Jeotgalibacillus sp. S-D1]TDL32986.1 class I SAM-dependent methyltransferase [Jeotgalibacillus sp. S-D1]